MSNEEGADGGAEVPFPVPPGMNVQNVGPLGLPVLVPEEGERVDLTPETGDGPATLPEDAEDDAGDPDNPLDAATKAGESFNEYLDRAIEEETCSFCESVLRDLKGRPLDEQMTGVEELKELKDLITGGEMPDEEEIADLLEDFEVVEMPGVE